MSDRTIKIGVGLFVSMIALAAIVTGYDAWFAPLMDCLQPPH
ncbi:hypothetical protein [Rhizorhabdus dicambivorans]|nr:hypothetical protein [Rhizorhabdus dicambivorans]